MIEDNWQPVPKHLQMTDEEILADKAKPRKDIMIDERHVAEVMIMFEAQMFKEALQRKHKDKQ